jgi:ribonuclease BN (tRNA processing enzyme)
MQVFFLGVGEACDPEHGNTSVEIVTAANVHVLCDCGFSVPHTYFSGCDDPDQLDLVWISHFHGDHFFGMPLLLLRLWEMGRRKPLTICSQQGISGTITQALELAFPGFGDKLAYELRFAEAEPGREHHINGLTIKTVETIHSQRNLGVLLSDGSKKLYYSGDGRPSEGVAALIEECDFAVHEAFSLEDEYPYHGSISGCLDLVQQCTPCTLALVHLERSVRSQQASAIIDILQHNPQLLLPARGTRFSL